MISKILFKNILIPVFYAILGVILYFFQGTMSTLELTLFIVGAVLAIILLIGDEMFLNKYYRTSETDTYLVTRSTLFLLSLVPLALFVATSSNSTIGTGLILALCSALFIEMWTVQYDLQKFHERFLSQVKKTYTNRDIQILLISAAVFIVIIHILAIW